MKSKPRSTLQIVAGATLLAVVSGCSNNDDPTPRFVPNGTIFSNFVKELFAADPATAEPTAINDLNFSFLDDNNPNAFNRQLE